MAVHEFYTTIEQNDVIGLVDSLAEKAGTPYRGVVPSGSTTANIEHNLNTTDVDVTVIRVNDGLQVGVPADRVDANNVALTFSTAPAGGEYRVIVSAGTGTGGGGGGGGGEGGTPDPHAASHASNGTDPVSPASIGAAIDSHTHSSDYAPLAHASRHASAGADPITPASIGAAGTTHSHSGTDITSGTVAFARLPTGTSSSQVAIGNHTHAGIGAHATNHALGGSDPLTPEDIGASLANHDHNGRIIPAGGDAGQALIKSSNDDYDVEWGEVSGGGDTPIYDPSVIKPFPAVNIIPQQFKYTVNGGPTKTALMARINAALGTHFRIDYTKVTGVEAIQALRIDNPTDGQSILIEYRNLSSAASLDQWGLDYAFSERDWTAAPYAAVAGQTPGPTDITNYDLGGIYPESVMWQSCAYYGLMYDARARAGAGAWRLLSNVTGYSV
jgi:hypothetical protein